MDRAFREGNSCPDGAGERGNVAPVTQYGAVWRHFPTVGQLTFEQEGRKSRLIRRINRADAAFSSEEESPGDRVSRENRNRKGNDMKKTILSIALAFVAPFAWAQTSTTSTTTTTTESDGTITEYTPGSMITLKETSGPRHYRFGKKVVYVTKSGRELDEETVRTRIKVGIPVHVHYSTEGDNMLVDRVILDED